MITYWLTHLLQRYDFSFWKILFVFFVQKFKGQLRTGCKLIMWSVVMFRSLPYAVNSFSKPSDQYYIAVAFLYFNMLQAVQSVQYTVRQNKYSSQFINVTFDGSCNRKKRNVLFLLTCIQNAYHFFTNSIIFFLKMAKLITMHPYHYHLSNTIHWHHLRYAWNITPLYE